MNANKKIINQIIRNVVQQNSVPDGTMPSSESSFALNKYLDDPHTVDLVYINLIERIRNEKSNYDQVLSRILKLIKNNIAIHPPSYQILLELDLFFISLSINSSLLIQKTVTYIRALIAHQVKQNPTYDVLKKQTNIMGGIINNESSGHKRTNSNSIGFLRYRSHSASNSVNTNKDDFSYQRSSLDLSNLLATSISSTTSSNSSSSSSSPISLNESPLKNTLLNNNNNSQNNSNSQNNQNNHLSPTLSSHNNNNHHISASSNNSNDPNLISSVTSSTSINSNNNSNNSNNVINSNNNNNINSTGSNLSIGHGSNNNNNNVLSNSSNQLGGSTNALRESTSSMSSNNGTPNSFLFDGFIRDLMSIKASTKSPAKTQSLLTHSPFGGLNHQNGESNIKSINKDIFKCPDDSQNWSKINIVRESKKKAEKKDQTIALTFRRRKPALFQYKYYKDQEPLKITEQEISQVVRVIINPATPQDRSIATKIFIKIILDIYCRDGLVVQSSEKLISNYFHQFISSTNRDTRAHTFNILFNLSVHINLYSELKLEDYQQQQQNGGLNNSGNQLSMIQDLHESIFRIVIEMVKHLVESKEKDERTWSEALSCVLFFITEEGSVIKDKLFQLSAQMVASFLTNISSMTDSVKRVLVRMLSNFLYKDSIANVLQIANTTTNGISSTNGGNLLILNDDEFNSIGGIQFILQLYTTVRSSEAKNNLFVIIFDYVLQTALKTQTIVDAQIVNESPLLLELFRRSDASHYFTQIFKCIPEHGFISKFFLYTSEEAKNSNDSSFSYEDLIIKFTMKLEEFATRYQSIDATFERLVIDCQDVSEKLQQLTTDSLENEDDEVTLLNVENWLFLLLKRVLIDKDQANYPQFNFSIQVYSNLASSSTRLRRMYISLTERLLLLLKFRLSTNETKTNEIFEMFNERFTKLIGQGEKSEANLMYMVDVMFDMIYKRYGTGLLRSKESTPDTNYSLFLSNQFVVSISLLKLFNINIIQYLFNNIQNSDNTKEQRLFLLHILIQRCNDSEDLLKVGGIGFFKNLLSDLSIPISYHASYFLLAQLEAESPEQYRTILTRLLQKARDNNNENLISNPIFQVEGIVELSRFTPSPYGVTDPSLKSGVDQKI